LFVFFSCFFFEKEKRLHDGWRAGGRQCGTTQKKITKERKRKSNKKYRLPD